MDNSGLHLFNRMVSTINFTSSFEKTVLVLSPIFMDVPILEASKSITLSFLIPLSMKRIDTLVLVFAKTFVGI